jgi:hypothetical protein
MIELTLKCPVCGHYCRILNKDKKKREFVDKKELWKFILDNTPHYGEETSMTYVKRSIEDAPVNEDVIEVVRCKNCEHFNTEGYSGDFGWCDVYSCVSLEKHFCSKGNRRVANNL